MYDGRLDVSDSRARKNDFQTNRIIMLAQGVGLSVLVSVILVSTARGQGDWVEYLDESSQRIVADPTIGIDDTFEKDLAFGDVDNDGDTDLIIVRKVRFMVPGGLPNVLFINESGIMVDRTAELIPGFLDATDDRDVALVDVDGDGWLDIVTVTTFAEQPRVYMNLRRDDAAAWRGFGYDPLEKRIPPFSPPPKFCSVGFGDVTGDQAPDLFFVDYDNNLEDRLLVNDGNGFFTDETDTRMTPEMSASSFGTAGEIVDINGDGFNDIVKCNTLDASPNSIRILYNDGTGYFDFMDFAYVGSPYMQATGDFNNDGRLDIFINDDFQDRYLLNVGNDAQGYAIFQTLTVMQSPNTAGFGGNIRLADLDLDGFLDVIVSDADTNLVSCDRTLGILQNLGDVPDITFWDPLNGAERLWLTHGTFDTAVLDINLDGTPDIWAGICQGNRVFIGVPRLLGDLDGDGDVDLFDLAAWLDCITGPVGGWLTFGCRSADLDGDDDVDFADYAIFQRAFTGGR